MVSCWLLLQILELRRIIPSDDEIMLLSLPISPTLRPHNMNGAKRQEAIDKMSLSEQDRKFELERR